jgi:hypothetical protein
MNDPQPSEIEAAEVEQLMEQAQQGRLTAQEQKRLVPLLKTLLWLQQTLLTTRISLTKLKRLLFGKRTEKHQRQAKGPNTDSDDGASGPPDSGTPAADQGMASSAATSVNPSKDDKGSNGGHGRRAAADYHGAESMVCPVLVHQPGEVCPRCERGRLYPFRPLVRLRFTGQPLAQAIRYELGQLRCNACGALWVASMPPEAPPETYDIGLKVNLALAHYQLGLPFKRIEAFQALLGMPLSDATQWELVESVADCAYPVYEALKRLGANQPLVYQDDTGARVLSLIRENHSEPPPPRQGMYTTVLRCEGEHPICLYLTGRQHAGENLDDLLAYRDPELPPMQWMSDGLAANTPQQHQDQTLDLNCLVHGRRKFVEIDAFFPTSAPG